MDTVNVKINGKNFFLSFGMGFLRVLGKEFETPTMGQTQQKVLEFLQTFNEDAKDIAFEQVDFINTMVISSAASSDRNTEIPTAKDLDELFFADTKSYLEIVTIVMKEFVASLPKVANPETAGKPKAPKKLASKNKLHGTN